jgi:hypothetical protein
VHFVTSTSPSHVNKFTAAPALVKERKPLSQITLTQEQRAQPYVDHPLMATETQHESTPAQMLQMLRQLSFMQGLEALQMWFYAPPHETITVSFLARIRRVEDHEALFLLENTSTYRAVGIEEAVGKAAKSPHKPRDFKIPIILTTEEDESYSAIGLLDSGCTDSAINRRLVKELNLPTKQFLVPRQSYNADGSKNRAGHVTEYTTLRLDIQGHPDMRHFVILDLGKTDVFIGLDWISHHNPEID